MKHDVVRNYLRRVRRHMTCDWNTRQMLLAKLEADLRGRDWEEDSLEELIARVGNPQYVASELMEAIKPSSVRFGAKKLRLAIVTLLVLLLLWCGFLVWRSMVYFHTEQSNVIVISEAKVISNSNESHFNEGDCLP